MALRAQLWYSIADISLMFGFGRSTVRLWWQQGRFGPLHECIKVNDDIRIPQSGVDFFIVQNRVVRTPEQIESNRLDMARKLAAREKVIERPEPQPSKVRGPVAHAVATPAAVSFSAQKNGGDHG